MKTRDKVLIMIAISALIISIIIISAEALPNIQLNPSALSLNMIAGQTIKKEINLTNTGDKTLFNITFTQLANVTFSNIPDNITKNQTRKMNVTVQGKTMSVQSVVQFYYKQNTTSSPKQYNVTITNTFTPQFITARQGDSIQWFNAWSTGRRVTESALAFDFTIPVNNTATYLAASQGIFNYFENSGGGFSGSITVNSNILNSDVHNPSLDKIFPITISTTQQQTTADMAIFLTNLNISYNQAVANALTITNTGNATANGVFVRGKWSNFNTTTYSLNPSETKFIQFNVLSIITNTSQTNRFHTIEINLSGSNIPTITKTISVFVKLHEFNNTNPAVNGTQYVYILSDSAIKTYCSNNPDQCPHTIQNQTIYAEIPHRVNVTTKMVEEAFQNYANWSQAMQRLENRVDSDLLLMKDILNQIVTKVNDMQRNITEMKQDTSDTKKLIEETESNRFWRNTVLMILAILLFIGGGIGGLIWWENNKRAGSHVPGGEYG